MTTDRRSTYQEITHRETTGRGTLPGGRTPGQGASGRQTRVREITEREPTTRETVVRSRIRVEGIVQGVGFRPFVHALATRHRLSGLVGNDAAGVFIEAEGPADAVGALIDEVRNRPPVLAVVQRVSVEAASPTGLPGFRIVPSDGDGPRRTLVAPDIATCADCLAELFDPADRRHRYPFVNCTNCGPRYTIITGTPYDRPATTMAGFRMCADCAREYADPADRRFHAQPTCCPACGPRLSLRLADGMPVDGDPVAQTVALLRAGSIVAIKGLGGYHLAADATLEPAVATLRARKHRPHKPFAIMAPDLATVAALCHLDEPATTLLTSPRAPIVLLPARPSPALLADSVAPGADLLGVLLPYTPPHHLIARELARPFVLTSGNVSDEPLAYRDDDAWKRLAGIADAFLGHDRPIEASAEDSVTRPTGGTAIFVRRARGYAPEPLTLPVPARRPLLACGAELKSTFCLARDHQAFVSPHLGDLENYETLCAFTTGITRFRRLFGIDPEVVAHDPHPGYLSTTYALDLPGVDLIAVQHHHAHIAACLADNGEPGPVIGVALDGTGYGPDGTIWGGEILIADLTGFTRAAHLAPVPLPGGPAAIRHPWRMAVSYLHAARTTTDLPVMRRHQAEWPAVAALVARPTLLTSSAGRLFDAVSALCGLRDTVTYEGQAAIDLERHADPSIRDAYPARVTPSPAGTLLIHGTDLVHAVVADLRGDTPVPTISARFHHGLAAAITQAVVQIAASPPPDGLPAIPRGLDTVALSGGVFANRFLLDALTDALRRAGLRVLTHRHVPCNDGGISLGQAAVAAARDGAAHR